MRLADLAKADGAIVAYRLDETTGTFAADAIGRQGGAYSGTVTLGVASPVYQDDGAAQFTTDGVVRIGHLGSILSGAPAISIEAVFRLDDGASTGPVLKIAASDVGQTAASLNVNAGATLTANGRSAASDSNQSQSGAAGSADTGQWIHAIAVIDYAAGTIALYKNAASIASGAATFGFTTYQGEESSVDEDSIAASLSNSTHLDCTVAFAAVYPSALTADQIAAHHAATFSTHKVNGTVTIDASPTARIVRAYAEDSGELLGEDTSDAGTGAYEIQFAEPAGRNVIVTCHDDYGVPWESGLAVTGSGFLVTPTNANGHYYSADGAGTTGGSEPQWPTNGGTVTDNGITWTDEGTMRAPLIEGPFIPQEI